MSATPDHVVIVPVWGAAHVARFLDWTLPSWLSPRNLPQLAAAGRVEIVLLAPAADLAAIRRHPATALLDAMCPLVAVEIDDLVAGESATVTLTLAFTRGANAATAQGRRPRLIFLNADFLLSDGALAAIARRFDAGQRLVLCASLRVREDAVTPALAALRRSDGAMPVPARAAVRLALGALHPTVLACRVDQPLLHSAHPNQFSLQPDPDTLLLRAFLLFPLAVCPDRPPGHADTYCDFGWITTLAPRAPVDIVASSDEMVIVELAPGGQELDFVRPGPLEAADAARRISVWANAFSRAQAATPIVFHATDPPQPRLAEMTAASGAFVADLLRRLGPPQPLADHPYWRAGVAFYLGNRRAAGIAAVPPELAAPPHAASRGSTLRARLRSAAKHLLNGRPGRRLIWHPYRRAERLMRTLGAVRVVGPASLADRFAVARATDGPALGSIGPATSAAEVVTALAAATPPGARAFLILDHDAGAAMSLGVRPRIDALAAVERSFLILAARVLVTTSEARAAARHRRLAVDAALVPPARRLTLALASAVSLVETLVANAAGDNGTGSAAEAEAATLLLVLERRSGDVGINL